MRTGYGRAVAAVVLLAAGVASWMAGQWERRVTDADRRLNMLQYRAPMAEYDEIEGSIGYASHAAGPAADLARDVREHRAAAHYWLADYDALAPTRDAAGAVSEKDAGLLLLAANAAFRSVQRDSADPQTTVRQLNGIIGNYADVLKGDASQVDAAYNYEYVARLRDEVIKNQRQAKRPGAPAAAKVADAAPAAPTDLPAGPTLHGLPGGPPPGTDMSQFKMFVPMQPDERPTDPKEGGTGEKKIRKG